MGLTETVSIAGAHNNSLPRHPRPTIELILNQNKWMVFSVVPYIISTSYEVSGIRNACTDKLKFIIIIFRESRTGEQMKQQQQQ